MTLTFDRVTLTLCQLQHLININNICKYHQDPSIRSWFIGKNNSCVRDRPTDRPTNITIPWVARTRLINMICIALFSRTLLLEGATLWTLFVCVCLSVCVCVCPLLTFLAYKSWTDGWILMILTYIIDINETLKVDPRSKSQGQRSRSY